MDKILYVANSIAYDSIRHAGGKTFNYYVKHLSLNPDNEVYVVGICKEEEVNLINQKNKFQTFPIISNGGLKIKIKRIFYDLLGLVTFRGSLKDSYYKKKSIIKCLKKLKRKGYKPDIVILEWTNIVLMVDSIKKIFPSAKFVASEHDVSFLGAERKYKLAKGLKRFILKRRYFKLKKNEIKALKNCNLILPHNFKDKNLLIENKVEENKISILTPYFNNMKDIVRQNVNKDILFWGAMNREENYEAALWFIENVMPLMKEDNVRFVVVGNNPPQALISKANDKIIVTGFVEDFKTYFEHSLCFVAPLFKGAGIKVKIIEAMSAGIPILTNKIGIEGIPASKGRSYFHCETAEDYKRTIEDILHGKYNINEIYQYQKEIIDKDFNLVESFIHYEKEIKSLI